ncbi:glycoside hydrolase family 18 protein [Jaapia argillacea MUCL 33604]|uniref:chitinase n=1 Tax=Jaapia argillacea MUCL 33604 TaxID=933084 RepID=A0A067PQA7_9AGAM|nr:glycoside hydrolase family 18 protein [Jaapia argillacea MUCL 33604]
MTAPEALYQPIPTDDAPNPPTSEPPTKPSPRYPIRKVLIFAVFFSAVLFGSFKAGHWWTVHKETAEQTIQSQAPEIPKLDESPEKVTPAAPLNDTDMSSGGKYSVGYFVNWGIYGRKFPPSLIPVQDLTHILYAFADLRPDTGEVVLSDVWADKDIHYPGDSWNDVGNNLYGNFKAIYNLKKQNRHLKVLLSIGGWTYSPKFHPIVVSPQLRAKFVASAIRLLEDYGLDGLDVDYEYPSDFNQARGYTELLRELREGLDRHQRNKGIDYRFLLTIAAPCGPSNYEKLHVRDMDRYLDFWNMMAYDFSGSWDSIANHQANIFGGPISASQAIGWYVSQGIPRNKIIMGIPLYGRSFANTQGPGSPFSGVGGGSWEQGVYDYRALPLPGAYVHRDEQARASWSYDFQKKEMVSFDTEEVGWWKGEWIKREGLGGSMFWELSGDKGAKREGMEGGHGKEEVPGRSLVRVVKDSMGGLDMSPNWLGYEQSQFDNMRNGMQ